MDSTKALKANAVAELLHDQAERLAVKDFEISRLKAALAEQGEVAQPAADETAWLIELRGNVPSWWSLDPDEEPGWLRDADKALRFARREDAENYINDMGWNDVFATEHLWCTSPNGIASQGEAAQPAADEISPYEWLAQEWDRLAILRKMWSAHEVAAMIRNHDIERPSPAIASQEKGSGE